MPLFVTHVGGELVARVGDLAPQVRVGRQVRVITEHSERPQLAYAAPNLVQPLLNSGGNCLIAVCVGQERVIFRRLALTSGRRVNCLNCCVSSAIFPLQADGTTWTSRVSAESSQVCH